jgi:hypothetical protein
MHLRGLVPRPQDTIPIYWRHTANPCKPRQTIVVDILLYRLHSKRLVGHLALVLHRLRQLARLLLHQHVASLYIQHDKLLTDVQRRGS